MASEISLVLFDMTMPGMGGEEAIGHFKEIRRDIPVIASSAFDEALTARRFAGKGIDGFIQKPYTSRELADRIKTTFAMIQGRL